MYMSEEYRKLYAGAVVGLSQTVLFNQFDNAIFKTQTTKSYSSIFNKEKWNSITLGLREAIFTKIVAYGVYHPLVDFYSNKFNNMNTSIAVATTTAILTNPSEVIRYRNVSLSNQNTSILNKFLSIYKKYGIKPFKIGMISKIVRDSIFSYCYVSSHLYTKNNNYSSINKNIIDLCCASVGVILGSPFNYARNIKLSNSLKNKELTYKEIYKCLLSQINKEKILLNKTKLIINKFNLIYGPIRVSIGIVLGRIIYDKILN